MGESGSVAWSASRGKRAKRIFLGTGLLLLLLICASAGWWCYLWAQASSKLASAIAKLDREDPGWQWNDLQARRAVVPDEENAAFPLEAAFRLLPVGWLRKPVPQDDESEQKSIVDQILHLEPTSQLDEAQIKELRGELEKVRSALVEARKLTGFTKGRYPAVPAKGALNGGTPCEHARQIVNLLLADVALLGQDQTLDAALDSCRGIVNAGRALGDDPISVTQIVRIACRHLAVSAIERALAQGQSSEKTMQGIQKLLEDEEQQPLLLYALRGERAYQHEQMKRFQVGDFSGGSGVTTGIWDEIQTRVGAAWMSGWLKENHVRQLEIMTEALDIAKLPAEEQTGKLHDLHARLKAETTTSQLSNQVFATLAVGGLVRIVDACARSHAQLRCAIVALALERYRLAHRHWPDSLEKLIPEFLPQVPLDTYDRKPLRYQRLEDGVAIYSIGPDGVDDGGKLDRQNIVAPGTDMVFRLWNVDRRRQPPAPTERPKPVPDGDQ